ncbi:hypothetical protein AB0L42_42500 [Streptomyces sp. NPDC052287]|uniref:hypothetical protein n=1 Tax=Streptomyces sp. NPDC052287 TaxID=3154950 RepID=UPI00344151BD
MEVVDRLVMAIRSQSSSDDRPDPEQFLGGLFDQIGIARGTAEQSAVCRVSCSCSAGAEEEVRETFRPLTREELLDELRGLVPAAARDKEGSVLRRIAEVVEQVDDEEAAYVWWLHAARAGDEVAVAIVDELALDPKAERPSVLHSLKAIPYLREQLKF